MLLGNDLKGPASVATCVIVADRVLKAFPTAEGFVDSVREQMKRSE